MTDEVRPPREKPTMDRRRFLVGTGALVVAAAGLEGFILEPRRLSVTRHRIGGAPESGTAAGAEADPLRLTLLTDLHLRTIGALEQAVAAEVADFAPHVVLVVGDAVDQADALPLLRDFLTLLPEGTSTFATLGNWEHWSGVDLGALAATYGEHSARLLVNESVQVDHRGRRATFVGLDDLVGGAPDLARAQGDTTTAANALLLAHCPAFRDRIPEGAMDGLAAVVSGHTHGGQVAVGGWAPLRPPGSGRYTSGWYRGDGPDLYVSRGVGTSVVPVRLGAAPEVAHFEWFLEPDPA